MWATLPLSIGSNRQFEPGRLLMYPISLRKLFAIDFISEVTNLQSIFAIPAIIAMGLGAGLGSGMLGLALIATIPAVVFGVALSKWLSISLGSLTRRRRTRGETLLALIGVVAGLGGALVGQLAPALVRHAESFRGLRWTPPGAAAVALTNGLRAGRNGRLPAGTGYTHGLHPASHRDYLLDCPTRSASAEEESVELHPRQDSRKNGSLYRLGTSVVIAAALSGGRKRVALCNA